MERYGQLHQTAERYGLAAFIGLICWLFPIVK